MIDIELIRNNTEDVKRRIARKGVNPESIDEVKRLDKQKRALQTECEAFQSRLNLLSKEISKEFGQKKLDLVTEASQVGAEVDKIKPRLEEMDADLRKAIMQLPNLPLDDVIDGASDKNNKTIYEKGDVKKLDFIPKDHIELAKLHDLIDFDAASAASGSRFVYLKNKLAILDFALMRFGLDEVVKKGFVPVLPPILLKKEVMEAAGYLQQGEDEIYHTQDDLYLAGTAEQPLLALHANQTINADKLPLRYVGYSSCFRREAGSYGKDVKGMIRMHQFQKLEMFSFVEPEKAEEEHLFIRQIEEELMQKLEIPYRVVDICVGDLGASAAKKWDIEAWMAGQNEYRETHSCSNCTEFQSRRMNIKYRSSAGTKFVATINGTVFSERPLIAILENNQNKDGSIVIPKVLVPYCGFDLIK
jgi:seryl-tRNA synthetase